MGYVFISYSSKNKDSADAIKNLLNKNNITTWMAPNDIPAGSKYASVIGNSIKKCSCFLLLLTNDSQNSIWVAKEVERAVNYKKVIIPVQLETVVLNDEFEMYISTDQITPIKKIDETLAEVQTLIATLQTYTETDTSNVSAPEQKANQSNNVIDAENIYDTGELPLLTSQVKTGDMINDKYQVLSVIEKGKNSTVYLAIDKKINKNWALKVIDKRFHNGKAYAQELAGKLGMLKALDSPFIPRIVDAIDTEESLIVVTDYIEGETLARIVKEYGAQPEDMVIQMAMELAETVKYLHFCRVLPDNALSAENIMIRPVGSISLMGLSSLQQIEYLEANDAECKRKDVFLIGEILYYAITGIDPHNRFNKMRPIRKINPELSKGFEYIVTKCTATNTKNRYQSVDELIADLENLCLPEYRLKRRPLFLKMRSLFKKK